jgi:aspartyl/asparaginyl beta-hydroxylase (cupin superfamily)
MSSKSKIWYSFYKGQSEDDHIGYYDNADFPWVQLLEDNYEVIKEEIKNYIHNNEQDIKPYFNNSLVTKAKSWRTFAFFFWTWKVRKNMKQCPETIKILQKIPHIVSASVSIMEPGVQIKPHRGDTNAVVRSHLALEVPATLPDCGFEVNGDEISWDEGKVFVFNDAARHTAWNHSDKRRYVLLMDVMRPEFVHKRYTVCSMVLGGLVMQSIFQNLPFLKFLPRFGKAIILLFHAMLINLTLRCRTVFTHG